MTTTDETVARVMGLVDELIRFQTPDMRLVNMRNDDWVDANAQPRNAARATLEAEVRTLAEERDALGARVERLRLTVIYLRNGAEAFGLSDEWVDERSDELEPGDLDAGKAAPIADAGGTDGDDG